MATLRTRLIGASALVTAGLIVSPAIAAAPKHQAPAHSTQSNGCPPGWSAVPKHLGFLKCQRTQDETHVFMTTHPLANNGEILLALWAALQLAYGIKDIPPLDDFKSSSDNQTLLWDHDGHRYTFIPAHTKVGWEMLGVRRD